MNMIGHHTPSAECVSLTLEVHQGVFNNRCRLRVFQQAASNRRVWVEFLRSSFRFIVGLEAPFSPNMSRDRINEAEGHKVGAALLVEVWEVASPFWRRVRLGSGVNNSIRDNWSGFLLIGHFLGIVSSNRRLRILWCGRDARTIIAIT